MVRFAQQGLSLRDNLQCNSIAHLAAQVVGRVSGVLKMTGKSEDERRRAMHGEAGSSEEVTATLEFEPPAAVRWARLDTAGRTKFITAFYAVPAGACLAILYRNKHSYVTFSDIRNLVRVL